MECSFVSLLDFKSKGKVKNFTTCIEVNVEEYLPATQYKLIQYKDNGVVPDR